MIKGTKESIWNFFPDVSNTILYMYCIKPKITKYLILVSHILLQLSPQKTPVKFCANTSPPIILINILEFFFMGSEVEHCSSCIPSHHISKQFESFRSQPIFQPLNTSSLHRSLICNMIWSHNIIAMNLRTLQSHLTLIRWDCRVLFVNSRAEIQTLYVHFVLFIEVICSTYQQ